MTLTTTATSIAYAGNGVTTAFPVPFVFFEADELQVIERTIAGGAEMLKELTAHYGVGGGKGATGTVTAVAPPPAGVEWHIRRATAKTQQASYVANDAFPAAVHERALDRLAAQAQENAAEIERALQVPRTDPVMDLMLPGAAARAGKALISDQAGRPVVSANDYSDANLAGLAADAEAAAGTANGAAAAAAAAAGTAAASAGTAAASAASAALAAQEAQGFGGAALVGTSASSLTIGTGAKGFVTQAGRGWTLGTRLRAASDDGVKFMEGTVTAYGGTALTLNVDLVGDSGTHADWNLSIAGQRGATGAAGAGTGDLLAANNLGDLASATTARGNLGAAASATTISAGTGLSGGGSLAANRTLALDINGLTAESGVQDADLLAIHDSSAGALRKMTRANFLAGVGGESNTASNVGASGQSLFKQKSGVDLQFRKVNVQRTTAGNGNAVVDANISVAVVSDVLTITLAVTYGTITIGDPGGGGGGGP